jgi:predicted amidohydrolase YtcJ
LKHLLIPECRKDRDVPSILIRDLAPDLILTNGRFLTMDPDLPEAEAVAIRDGRILAVGTTESIQELAGAGTTVRDLGGRRAIPGIIDTHNHMLSMGKVFNEVQFYSARSIEDIKELVAERVRTSPPGSWILGRGWDESLLAEKRFPNRHDLDEVAPNNPVVLDRVWNMLLANSAALNAADIGRTTPDPPADALYAGRIERDDSGDPTGVFRDRAKQLIKDVVPPDSPEDLRHAIRTACREYNALGMTSVAEPGLYPEQIHEFQQVAAAGDLGVRVSLCLAGWGFGSPEQDATTAQRVNDTGVFTGFGDRWLRMDAV